VLSGIMDTIQSGAMELSKETRARACETAARLGISHLGSDAIVGIINMRYNESR